MNVEASLPHVSNEYGRLQSVLMKPPGLEATKRTDHWAFDMASFPGVTYNRLGEGATTEHAQLVDLLESQGVQVVNVLDEVDAALDVAKSKGILDGFLTEHFPVLRRLSRRDRNDLAAVDIYGGGKYNYATHGVAPMPFSDYTRDPLVITPDGVLVARLFGQTRGKEPVLMRFMFDNSPHLQGHKVIYDATAQENGPYFEGGDTSVFDQNTIVMGVGGASEPRAAEEIATATGMDVMAVKTAELPESFLPIISNVGLHLDALLTIVSNDLAFATPYFLENEFGPGPFYAFIDRYVALAKEEGLSNEQIENLLAARARMPEDIGMVTIYEGGSGRKRETGQRLVTHLREERGMTVGYTAGKPEEDTRHQIEHLVYGGVFDASRFLIANGLSIAPNHFVGPSDDAGAFHEALRRKGVQVDGISLAELRKGGGAVHCLTAPLKRA